MAAQSARSHDQALDQAFTHDLEQNVSTSFLYSLLSITEPMAGGL
jgi:hypothetical protein